MLLGSGNANERRNDRVGEGWGSFCGTGGERRRNRRGRGRLGRWPLVVCLCAVSLFWSHSNHKRHGQEVSVVSGLPHVTSCQTPRPRSRAWPCGRGSARDSDESASTFDYMIVAIRCPILLPVDGYIPSPEIVPLHKRPLPNQRGPQCHHRTYFFMKER